MDAPQGLLLREKGVSPAGVPRLSGKICVVTGANSGIGFETARGLSVLGAEIVMVARNRERGATARDRIAKETGNRVDLVICDLSIMAEVKRLAGELSSSYPKVHFLDNNAGAVFLRRTITPEGHEATLALDYLTPFAFTHLMLPSLCAGAPSRVINVTSGLQRRGSLHLDDLESTRSYSGMSAYANAKLMLTMFTYYAARLLDDPGVTVNCLEPGFVATNLGRNSGSLIQSIAFGIMRPFQISPAKAAETPIYLALSSEVDCVTGKCFAKKAIVETPAESYDEGKQRLLYDTTIRILGLDPME